MAVALSVGCAGLCLPSLPAASPLERRDQPSAPCTSGLTRLDRRTGGGIPLPPAFYNPTSSAVTFTVRMSESYFFGPAHDVKTITLPAHTGRIGATVLPTFLHTPLGSGSVVITVRTDRTGGQVVGRCDYRLRLSAPPGVDAGTPLRPIKRWLRQVPVQFCALEGSELAGSVPSGQTVPAGRMLGTLAAANDSIWYPQAQVAFSTAGTTRIPVIRDPTPPNGANGELGDVDGLFPFEAEAAAGLCRQAWARRSPGRRGIPVVNARRFFQQEATLAVAPGPATDLYVASRRPGTGKRGDALCGAPVRLTRADVDSQFVVMPDASWRMSTAARTLAHELGHALFLGHGNGLDDDGNGRPAGFSGPRRYDEYCDPGWLAAPENIEVAEDVGRPPCSLMQRSACSLDLRPLQVETARGVARFAPGSVDGTPAPGAR